MVFKVKDKDEEVTKYVGQTLQGMPTGWGQVELGDTKLNGYWKSAAPAEGEKGPTVLSSCLANWPQPGEEEPDPCPEATYCTEEESESECTKKGTECMCANVKTFVEKTINGDTRVDEGTQTRTSPEYKPESGQCEGLTKANEDLDEDAAGD